jgi:hypothetical protein
MELSDLRVQEVFVVLMGCGPARRLLVRPVRVHKIEAADENMGVSSLGRKKWGGGGRGEV